MSNNIKKTATLSDGRTLEYIETDDPPSGAMKKTFFSPDRSYVIQFFLDKKEDSIQRRARLDAILKTYNPSVSEQDGGAKGTTPEMARLFKDLYCWPTGIVTQPELGIVAPVYPGNYFFPKGNHLAAGEEKQGNWFLKPKARKHLPQDELGNAQTYLSICIKLARAVRRLHVAGLAHSDLSSKNILIDPKTGQCTIIDIDSLVVPGLFPPDVLGTPDYIAPEVLVTQNLKLGDPKKKTPGVKTDLHALAVLIYQYLFMRHPLRGPKPYGQNVTPEIEELMLMGEKALFIEHTQDQSNRPQGITIPFTAFGAGLADLFKRAFIDGLHSPDRRPYAMEWERELLTTWNLLYPCGNSQCELKWYVIDDQSTKCPCCSHKPNGPVVRLKFSNERQPGNWIKKDQLIAYHNIGVYRWHAFNGMLNDGMTDKTRMAFIAFHQNKWLLVNENLTTLTSPGGNIVPKGQAVELKEGVSFMLSTQENGIRVEVEYVY
jgi:hypothetical protein